MTFDLHVQIEDHSPEALVLESIINRDHVSAEEAVRRALRHPALSAKSPSEAMIGAFSSPDDSSLLDDIVREAYEHRRTDQPRDLGL